MLWERNIPGWSIPDQGVDVADQRIQVHRSREHPRLTLIPRKLNRGPGSDRGPNWRKSIPLLVNTLVKNGDLCCPRRLSTPNSPDEPVSKFAERLLAGPSLFTQGLVARLQGTLEAAGLPRQPRSAQILTVDSVQQQPIAAPEGSGINHGIHRNTRKRESESTSPFRVLPGGNSRP